MISNNRRIARLTTRLSFILVLLMGFLGWWYASNHWQITPDDLRLGSGAEQTDWVESVATLGEEAIQLFLGLAGNSQTAD